MHARNVLEAAIFQVQFDRENIVDLIMSRDLSENASIELQNISSDKRALREKQSFFLNEVIFESPNEFRVYNIDDVVQLRIKDINETFASLKLAEMPICEDEIGMVHFI